MTDKRMVLEEGIESSLGFLESMFSLLYRSHHNGFARMPERKLKISPSSKKFPVSPKIKPTHLVAILLCHG